MDAVNVMDLLSMGDKAPVVSPVQGILRHGANKAGGDFWCLKDNNGNKLHSTQKPVELLKRIILTSTNEGDLILDPVAGTGTTGFVAMQLNRRFTMIEKNENYIKGIMKRLESDPIYK